MAVPTDNKVSIKEYCKISKYKDLEIKIENIWHLKITTLPDREILVSYKYSKKFWNVRMTAVPNAVGALRTVPKGLQIRLEELEI